jgi:hypothetical protein
MKKQMSFLEQLFYYLSVVVTVGGAFALKAIIKKAIIESKE